MKKKYSLQLLALLSLFSSVVLGQQVVDSAPQLLTGAKYTLTQSVIDAEIGGKVQISILVDETGKPEKAALTSGPMWPCGVLPLEAISDLEKSMIDMAMTLKFKPAIKKGKPSSQVIGLNLELANPRLTPKPEIDPSTGKAKAKMIVGGVLNGKAIELARPYYPAEAKANRDGGAVSVQVLIGEDGKVLRAGAISGVSTLQFAARDAACRSRFEPTRLAGNPVKVSGMITYNFVP